MNDIGIPKDENKTFKWYLNSAKGGNSRENSHGQLKIGNCYRNGIGISKNEKKAFEWHLKSE